MKQILFVTIVGGISGGIEALIDEIQKPKCKPVMINISKEDLVLLAERN